MSSTASCPTFSYPDRARPRGRGPGRCGRNQGRRSEAGRAGRRALAGLDLRALRVLRGRTGTCTSATARSSPATPATAGSPRTLVADARYCFPLGEAGDDAALAPLLRAGLIGWRSLVMAGGGKQHRHLRLWRGRPHRGAGRALARAARSMPSRARAMRTRKALARSLGAVWAGASEDALPAALDAAMIYAPVGALVPLALRAVRKGGRVVCAGIHMSDIPAFPYSILWQERQLLSVALCPSG